MTQVDESLAGDNATYERHLPFESVFNFRDLGGYRTRSGATVRWRTLFRADGVHRLTVDDLASLDVRTVIDLRTPEEHERGRFSHDSIGYHHLPILQQSWDRDTFTGDLDPVAFLSDRYVDMLSEGRDAITRALRIMTDVHAFPLVFHCAAGKDRTGVVAAIVLSVLGVNDDDIADDYSLSRLGMGRFKEWIMTTFPDAADSMSSQPSAFLDAPAPAMHRFLERVRRDHGSVLDYLAGLGITAGDLEAVRRNLLV